MTESKNKSSKAFFSNVIGVAKKLSTSLDSRQNSSPQASTHPSQFELQDVLKQQFPQLSQQLLGQKYPKISQLSAWVAPSLSDHVSEYLVEQINSFSHRISTVDAILDEAGAQELEDLTRDVQRSKRLSQALVEQNKWLASAQGAVSGVTGWIGMAIDLPCSLILSLRTIYQIGQAYGFELDQQHEKEIIQYIFKQIDLNLITDKQTMLIGLKTLSHLLKTQDDQKIQKLNIDEQYLAWIKSRLGEVDQLHPLFKTKLLPVNVCIPVLSASLNAVYNWRLIEDVHVKAQTIFSQAREYLQQHQQDLHLSPMAAYEKSLQLFKTTAQHGEYVHGLLNQHRSTALATAVQQTADTPNDVWSDRIRVLSPSIALIRPPYLASWAKSKRLNTKNSVAAANKHQQHKTNK